MNFPQSALIVIFFGSQKVAECMCKSAKHLQEVTYDAARVALENVADALSISRYSEKLLEMKGEALCIVCVVAI